MLIATVEEMNWYKKVVTIFMISKMPVSLFSHGLPLYEVMSANYFWIEKVWIFGSSFLIAASFEAEFLTESGLLLKLILLALLLPFSKLRATSLNSDGSLELPAGL